MENMQNFKSEKYKNVYYSKKRDRKRGVWYYKISVNKVTWQKEFFTEREAAVALDKQMLAQGLEPINIFIKK